MHSLSDLNTYSASQFEFADSRPSGVKFDREIDLVTDKILDITTTTVTITPPVEIEEIINYQTANVRYKIEIIPAGPITLIGSTITWFNSLPTGSHILINDSSYTVYGINSVADWNQIKNFHWNLPANYDSCSIWYLRISIIYNINGVENSLVWNVYDKDHYYFCAIYSKSTMLTSFDRVNLFDANLTSDTSMYAESGPQYEMFSYINSTATLFLDTGFATLTAKSTTSCSAVTIKRLTSNMLLTNIMNTDGTHVTYFNNLTSKTYLKNHGNSIFELDPPSINATYLDGDLYYFKISSPDGKFAFPQGSLNAYYPVTTATITGTIDEINVLLPQVRFYPTVAYTSTTTFTCTLDEYTNSSLTLRTSRTLNLNYAGAYSIPTKIYTITSNSQWYPDPEISYYGKYDFVLVGGGGGGGRAGGGNPGGGGGQVTIISNVNNFSPGSYHIIIGNGGLVATLNNGYAMWGGAGYPTSITDNLNVTVYTAAGGYGGGDNSSTTPGSSSLPSWPRDSKGGRSGNGHSGATPTIDGGGGGGGDAGVGGAPTVVSGGTKGGNGGAATSTDFGLFGGGGPGQGFPTTGSSSNSIYGAGGSGEEISGDIIPHRGNPGIVIIRSHS